MKKKNKGFMAIEYAFLIMIIVVALIGTAIYFKRAISGRMREAGDSFGNGRQFDPYTTSISHPK